MGELHEATIEWAGDADAASLFIAAAQAFDCETNCVQEGGGAKLTVKVQNVNLQDLRDCVDALLIQFAEIEETL
tara:strand:+ start:1430 stop:1651 length:222 start_codon:yes stop_codon:yes gene_type:complete